MPRRKSTKSKKHDTCAFRAFFKDVLTAVRENNDKYIDVLIEYDVEHPHKCDAWRPVKIVVHDGRGAVWSNIAPGRKVVTIKNDEFISYDKLKEIIKKTLSR